MTDWTASGGRRSRRPADRLGGGRRHAAPGGSVTGAGERLFIAWFGVRGVAALYHAAVAVGADALSPAEQSTVFLTTAVCVMVSIVVHGASATALARRLLD